VQRSHYEMMIILDPELEERKKRKQNKKSNYLE